MEGGDTGWLVSGVAISSTSISTKGYIPHLTHVLLSNRPRDVEGRFDNVG